MHFKVDVIMHTKMISGSNTILLSSFYAEAKCFFGAGLVIDPNHVETNT